MWSVLPCSRAPMTVERRNRKVLVALTGMVGVMGAAAWASVPLYDWFCRVTGFGGATVVSEQASEEVLDRTITVRFDASLERGMPWTFRPLEIEIETKIGENRIAFYEAHNPTDAPIAGRQATMSIRSPQGSISSRSTASVSGSSFCSRGKGSKCRSASMLIRRSSTTAKRTVSARSFCPTPSTGWRNPPNRKGCSRPCAPATNHQSTVGISRDGSRE